MELRGTGVAVVTPFEGGQIDYQSLAKIIDYITKGVDYIVSLGSTGEAALLSEQERLDVLRFTIDHLAGRLPLIAGNFGDNSTARLVDYISGFDFSGIDGIMCSCPAYIKPTQDGLLRHYIAVGNAAPVPVIVYNVPGRTAVNMRAETAVNIAQECHNVIGIKEAAADMQQARQLIKHAPPHLRVLSGDDPTALEFLTLGGQGVISVIANAYPILFARMVRHALNGQGRDARMIHNQLNPMHALLYADGNPAGIKSALASLELCANEVRLPLTTMTHENALKLKSLMRMLPPVRTQ